ncbi:unnamed protein product [Adineta steineri]|uniref:HAD family hydrolase n=2 Tax=Adineta steineri TaxID=433720 RepID=A0A814EMK9_9BILA|nr:unnamed protein product [Adineta steineri]CAF0971262.1 unnamed protein product [Adineta steineri]CAF1148917.1 unnamed protein product [Adineta steineri]CAF1150679.1 unnamed protein product [Adineta steineri]CAF3677677.1 unnamed protein product [Adineta steineri]
MLRSRLSSIILPQLSSSVRYLSTKRPELDAVIFDVDGTLIDTVDYHAKSWQDALEYYNIKSNLADVRMQIGKAADQLLPMFATEEQIRKYSKDISARKAKVFEETYLEKVKPFPGVRELFELIKKRNIPIALASSAKTDELELYKNIANVSDLVDFQTSSNSKDVKRSKPYPDIFLAALKLLKNPSTDRVIVVGDTPWDAQAAVAAKLRIAGVLCGGVDEKILRESGCSWIYKDIIDLTKNYDKLTKEVLKI